MNIQAWPSLKLTRNFVQLLPLFRTKDFQEGIQAFLEKREPKFEGR